MNNLVEENKELKEEILRLREKIAEYDKIYHKHSYETHERYLDFVDSYNCRSCFNKRKTKIQKESVVKIENWWYNIPIAKVEKYHSAKYGLRHPCGNEYCEICY